MHIPESHVRIRISFIFSERNSHHQQERLQKARRLLEEHAAIIEEENYHDSETIIIALISLKVLALHHSFESKLNKTWPLGCEASEVVVI